MKVNIYWTEEVSYESTIEIDDAEFAEFRRVNGRDGDPAEDLVEFIQVLDQSEWFEQCDITKDFKSVDERSVYLATKATE